MTTLNKPVNRSELRSNQSAILDKAVGENIVVVKAARKSGRDKYIVDGAWFDSLAARLESAAETIEIMTDRRLFQNIVKSMDTLDEDMRLGRLHSFEDAFSKGDTQ